MKIIIERLSKEYESDKIKVLVGKTKEQKAIILNEFHNYVAENVLDEKHVIHMNLGSLVFRGFTDYDEFVEYTESKLDKNEKYILIYNEIQNIDNWQDALLRIQKNCKVNIYVSIDLDTKLDDNKFTKIEL